MKVVVIFLLVILLALPSLALAGQRVRGHWTDTNHDGIKDTWVNPHERTSPNSLRIDNYGYPGNYNPNTGRVTPPSSSPRELYPFNPNPYEKSNQKKFGW